MYLATIPKLPTSEDKKEEEEEFIPEIIEFDGDDDIEFLKKKGVL